MTPEGFSGRPESSRRRRTLLSLFFLLHWGSVAVYLLPAERASVEQLPDWLEPVAMWTIPRAARAAWPVAKPYLDLTATRQHWTLFAPWPANWSSSIRVVPYFAVPGEPGRWRADTLVVRGAVEAPLPHILDHRTFRVLYNLGYPSFGQAYRPHFAQEMCRTLRSTTGAAPDGVALTAVWRLMAAPWTDDEDSVYHQWLGGFDCSSESRETASGGWSAYGLPAALDVSGWPTVSARDTADASARPPGSAS